MLFLTLSALSSPLRAASMTVYLAPKASTLWDGNCNGVGSSCSKSSPCSFSASTITVEAASQSCKIVFLPGHYQSTPLSLVGGQNVSSLEATLSSGVTDSLHLTIASPSCKINSSGSVMLQNSNLTFVTGSLSLVEILNLETSNTPFNFASLSEVYSNITVNVTSSTFSAKTQGTSLAEGSFPALFNFVGLNAQTPTGIVHSLVIQKSSFNLSSQTGLVSASVPILRIRLMETTIGSARHLLSTTSTSPVNIQLLNMTKVSTWRVFDNISGAKFDARNASSLDLHLSTLSSPDGPESLAEIQENACAHLSVSQSNVTSINIGCNNNADPSPHQRCNFSSIYSNFIDNAICFIGPQNGSNDDARAPKLRSTFIEVRSPLSSIQTLFQHVHINGSNIELLNSASSRRDGVFKFRGTVRFSALSKLMTNDMDIAGSVTIMTLQLRGRVHMAHGSSLQGVTELGAPRWIFKSPLSFIGDHDSHDYSAVVDLKHYSSLRVILGGPVSLHREPLIKFQNGAYLAVSNALELLSSTIIDWNSTNTGGVEPAEGAMYDLFESVTAVNGSEPARRVATKQSSAPYSFSAWLTPKDNMNRMFLATFGLQSSFPPYVAPSAVTVPSNSPRTLPTPSTVTPPPPHVRTPNIDDLECTGTIKYPGFKCVDAQWIYNGNLELSSELVIPSLTSPITIYGSLSLSNGNIRFVGESSTVRVKNCTIGGAGVVILDYFGGWPDAVHLWSHVAILQSESCSTSASSLPVVVRSSPGCKVCRWNTDLSMRYALKVSFSLSRSKCLLYIGVGVGVGVAGLIVLAVAGIATYRWYAEKKRKASHYESLLSDLD